VYAVEASFFAGILGAFPVGITAKFLCSSFLYFRRVLSRL